MKSLDGNVKIPSEIANTEIFQNHISATLRQLKEHGLIGCINPEVKPKPFYDLRQMLEGPDKYYFKQNDELDLIDVIVNVAVGKHREWIHNRNIDKF